VFPADAGAHPGFQTEWWYYTGNLADAAGARYGFELTFFRRALAATMPPRRSAWGTRDVYLAHLALTDVAGRTFHSAERTARGGLGLSGAQADPFHVWVESWSALGGSAAAGDETVRLTAADGPVALALDLTPAKVPARHGRDGLSQKGPEPGNASYYYSYPRLAASGTLTTATGAQAVEGTAWMDHEWSTSALSTDQGGWDWFALQLDDGTELMLYQIREKSGGSAPESSGSLVDRVGAVTPLAPAAFRIQPTASWTSPRTGAQYPSAWRLAVPGAGLDLTVTPLLADQELSTGVRYWEGAVRVDGIRQGRPVGGYGYVELTGYADSAARPGLP